MSKPDDGGPAFPRPISEDRTMGDQHDGNTTISDQEGMSLRDWFAGMGMMGLMQRLPALESLTEANETMHTCAARIAYTLADAMLAERSKQ